MGSLTTDQILATFESYNLDIWPMQAVAYLLGIVAFFFAVKRTQGSGRITLGDSLLPLALDRNRILRVLFQSSLRSWLRLWCLDGHSRRSVLCRRVETKTLVSIRAKCLLVLGLLFVAYAMIGYPLVGHSVGHDYPRTLPFGLVPCPTTVFTFGLFMLSERRMPRYFLVIPILLTVVAVVPVSQGVLEDIGLIITGVVGAVMILFRDSKRQMIAA